MRHFDCTQMKTTTQSNTSLKAADKPPPVFATDFALFIISTEVE